MKKKLLGLAGSTAIAASLLTAMAPPASAAVCSGSRLGSWPITGGHIVVYYNGSTGRNCAMTYTSNPGRYQHIQVTICANGGSCAKDSGTYKYYAGPVSVYARHTCISFNGEVGNGGIEGFNNVYCD